MATDRDQEQDLQNILNPSNQDDNQAQDSLEQKTINTGTELLGHSLPTNQGNTEQPETSLSPSQDNATSSTLRPRKHTHRQTIDVKPFPNRIEGSKIPDFDKTPQHFLDHGECDIKNRINQTIDKSINQNLTQLHSEIGLKVEPEQVKTMPQDYKSIYINSPSKLPVWNMSRYRECYPKQGEDFGITKTTRSTEQINIKAAKPILLPGDPPISFFGKTLSPIPEEMYKYPDISTEHKDESNPIPKNEEEPEK
ncbi:uncharacterized protein LOC110180561 [Drosophila serrata]|uniref:uncharacterized protein LOC110180561 n=1 Tax=Drosophila serrata TaxID=7274 RepID=UPI000A1D0864|nr:uncharacterized protein LOC110180561 [Drosophila serrata]XP_020803915.1 uncharacterized protein LOC110180561 [Drosophila serrata]